MERGRLSFESRADTKIEFPALALAGWKKRRGRTYAKSSAGSSVDFHLSLSLPFFVFCFFSLSLSLFVSFSRCLHCVHPSQGYILIPFPALVSDNFRPAGNSIRNGAL